MKLSSLGDVIHATSCLEPFRRAYPDVDICMAVDRRYDAVVRHNPNVDALVSPPRRDSLPLAYYVRARRELAAKAEGRFGLAVDLQGTRESALWVYASRSGIKAGRGGVRPGWHVVVRPDLTRHAVCVCSEVAGAVGVPMPSPKPEIFLSDEDDDSLTQYLAHGGIPECGFVLINPFSRWPSKAWPAERYARLISMVKSEFDVAIVVSGGPGEESLGERLFQLLERGAAHNLVGCLTLGQAFCLYRRAALMVTGDSGPMHAAAALGTGTVALFGPTFPERTGPWGEGHVVIQSSRPGFHHAYRTDTARQHIRAIGVEAVYGAVARCLTGQGLGERRGPPPAGKPGIKGMSQNEG